MSVIAKLKKDELKLVAEELGLEVPDGSKIIALKLLIENSDVFKTDTELVKNVVDYVIEEKRMKIERENEIKLEAKSDNEMKLEIEKIKLAQLQKEIEIANIRKESPIKSQIFEKNHP